MSDYIERDKAFNAVLKLIPKVDDDGYCWVIRGDAATAIDSIHAADVAEVVRCKDCRHRDPEDNKCDCGQLERAGCVFPVDDDYFCAYGKKRETDRFIMDEGPSMLPSRNVPAKEGET